jgi:murein DD-endopeptidase MepM/ murein hydrolase activator NlpD
VKSVEYNRSNRRSRFFLRLGVGLVVLIGVAYFSISFFGSSGATESSLESDIPSSLSLARQSGSVVEPPGSSGGSVDPETVAHTYASPSQIHDVVPMGGPRGKPFEQTETIDYLEHSVKPGESLWSIARRYDRSIHSIVSTNQTLLSEYSYLPKGTELRIPNRDGILTYLKQGQTLWDIMKSYDVDYRRILSFNGLESASSVRPGQALYIPGAQPLNTFKHTPDHPSVKGFSWPVSPGKRRVTSPFGERFHPLYKEEKFHRGIDIGSRRGTAVFASRPGDVVYAKRYGNYGKTVVIEHEDGYETWYAHLSRVVVQNGQFVERGQPIAFMGSSGLATGVNLHFEVKRNGEFLNPRNFLPDK